MNPGGSQCGVWTDLDGEPRVEMVERDAVNREDIRE